MGELWCLTPLLTIFQLYHGYLVLLVEYTENRRPATSLTNFINNVVSSNKGILIADTCIYIHTTVYINLKNTPPSI